MMLLELPWPPSVNHYYRHSSKGVYISKEGQEYRDKVVRMMCVQGGKKCVGPVKVYIDAYPPDNRRRDLDNILKCLLDSLQHGGAFEDDSQVAMLIAEKNEPVKDGLVNVMVIERQG